jgi:branched-chain amino acid transport system substrate-binding protein
MAQNEIDFFYYGGRSRDICRLMRQARDEGCKARFMSSDSGPEKRSAGEVEEGLVVTSPGRFNELEHHRAMAKEGMPQQTFIPNPSAFFLSYAAVQVLAQGILAAGFSSNTGKIARVIRSGTFDTTVGSLSFRPNGDSASPEFVVEEFHDGEEGIT